MARLFIDIKGLSLTAEDEALIGHPNLAGLVLFADNYQNKLQLKTLTRQIRNTNPNLIITVDQEGGASAQVSKRRGVQRFVNEFSELPAAKDYGEVYETTPEEALTMAQTYGYNMARELLECGIDASLAPVLDLDRGSNIISAYDRAFHKDPDIVARIAKAFISGMNRAGMAATGKHFPGHGSILLDSHITQPIDERTLSELVDDLKPFQQLKDELAAIMPAHILFPKIDPEHTVGASIKWLNILRNQIGFNGLIISDCLSMAGAGTQSLLEKVKSTLACCDAIIVTHIDSGYASAEPNSEQKNKRALELRAILDALEPTPDDIQFRINALKGDLKDEFATE